MPVKKKQTRTKTTSTANKGKKRTAASASTTSKKGTRKTKVATARSASKPRRKSQPAESPSTDLERRPLSPAGKIVAKATKVALTTQSRAKRWVERVQQAVAKATEIPDKVISFRKRGKSKKENT